VDRVAVVFQPGIADAEALATGAAEHVARRGCEPALLSSWDLNPATPANGLALAIGFGGDGSTLRIARWLARGQVPIVGIKMGRLGFLAELQPEDLFGGLDPYLAGDYWLDERTMIQAELLAAPGGDAATATPLDVVPRGLSGARAVGLPQHDLVPPSALPLLALNDVVVSRGTAGRAVRATIEVDGTELAQYTADGVIVATATGSTAYAFAAGGPILMPELPNLVVTAICPHLHGLNGLVLPPDVTVTVRISTPLPATCSLDGHIDLPVLDGQGVSVQVAGERTRFARRGRRSDFYRSLLDKLR
jgi:NAD+ kinase